MADVALFPDLAPPAGKPAFAPRLDRAFVKTQEEQLRAFVWPELQRVARGEVARSTALLGLFCALVYVDAHWATGQLPTDVSSARALAEHLAVDRHSLVGRRRRRTGGVLETSRTQFGMLEQLEHAGLFDLGTFSIPCWDQLRGEHSSGGASTAGGFISTSRPVYADLVERLRKQTATWPMTLGVFERLRFGVRQHDGWVPLTNQQIARSLDIDERTWRRHRDLLVAAEVIEQVDGLWRVCGWRRLHAWADPDAVEATPAPSARFAPPSWRAPRLRAASSWQAALPGSGYPQAEVHDDTTDVHDGTTDLHDGTTPVHDGTSDLHDGTSDLHGATSGGRDGTGGPHDGTSDDRDGTSGGRDGTVAEHDDTHDHVEERAREVALASSSTPELDGVVPDVQVKPLWTALLPTFETAAASPTQARAALAVLAAVTEQVVPNGRAGQLPALRRWVESFRHLPALIEGLAAVVAVRGVDWTVRQIFAEGAIDPEQEVLARIYAKRLPALLAHVRPTELADGWEIVDPDPTLRGPAQHVEHPGDEEGAPAEPVSDGGTLVASMRERLGVLSERTLTALLGGRELDDLDDAVVERAYEVLQADARLLEEYAERRSSQADAG